MKVSEVQGGRGAAGLTAAMSKDLKRREHLKGPMLPKWLTVKGRSTMPVARELKHVLHRIWPEHSPGEPDGCVGGRCWENQVVLVGHSVRAWWGLGGWLHQWQGRV